MQLAAGSRLGNYRILAPLAAGGMGEVYRARQQGLDRDVALKVLPAKLAADNGALQRFEREAKALAGLSHPHILAIYDFVPAGPPDAERPQGWPAFAVTELLEGQTLRARLDQGSPPPRRAVELLAQAARGLAAAHERGIVHRDLKPDNLFITADGTLKILDFGLARHKLDAEGAPETPATPDTPTLSRLTEPGTVMGTVGYMSPEQVRGRDADHRSDIFSLGAVAYEMLSGRRPFQRGTAAETMTAILRDDPPELTATHPQLPPALERIVRHCLEKRPEERFQSARDLAFDLQTCAESGWSAAVPGLRLLNVAGGRRLWLRTVAWLLVLTVGFGLGRGLRPSRARQAVRALAPQRFQAVTDAPGVESHPALSPDGASVAYAARGPGREDFDLFSQRVGGRNALRLTGDSAADEWAPAFSPDGRLLAFRSGRENGGIFVIGATGESRRRLTDFGFDPAWSPDGRWLLVTGEPFLDVRARSGSRSPLWRVDVASGQAQKLFEGDAMQPVWSPDGTRVAFWGVPPGTGQRDLWTLELDKPGARPVQVTDDAALDWNPLWMRDGRGLLFLSDRGGTANAWRLPIDPRSGAAAGVPEPFTLPASSIDAASLAANGRSLAYVGSQTRTRVALAEFDPAAGRLRGELRGVMDQSRAFWMPDIAPDGRTLALSSAGPREDLYLLPADGSGLMQLTDDEARDRGARFSPDGQYLAFYSNRGGRYGLWLIHRDGSGLRRLTPDDDQPVFGTPLWSADGSALLVPGDGPRLLRLLEGGRTALEKLPLPAGATDFDWRRARGGEVLGFAKQQASQPQLHLLALSLREARYRPLGSFPYTSVAGGVPLDERRLLVPSGRGLELLDLASGSRRHVLDFPGGSGGSHPHRLFEWNLTPDGRHLVLLARTLDADIWVAEVS